MRGSQPQVNIFFQPDNLGALPALWLQAKLTISLTSIQEKFAILFMTIAAELWLRGRFDTPETVFQATARNFTIRLAETSAKYLCSLMRRAKTLATSEMECLLYATHCFRPMYKKQSGTQREKKHVLTLTLMLVRRKSACTTSAGSSKILRWLTHFWVQIWTPKWGPSKDLKEGMKM